MAHLLLAGVLRPSARHSKICHLQLGARRSHERGVVESAVLNRNIGMVYEELRRVSVPRYRRDIEALPYLLSEYAHLIIVSLISTC